MKKNGFAPIIILIVIGLMIIVGYFGYKYSQSYSRTLNLATNQIVTPAPIPTSTPFAAKPQPLVNGWKTYTDKSDGVFSFEYPDFMPEPSIYWPGETVLHYVSIYTWQIDKMSSGNYEHNINLHIEGPYPDSSSKDLVEWIKDQNSPYKEGILELPIGSGKTTYKTMQGKNVVESVFTETGSKYPKEWILYINTIEGVYRLDLNVQGTEDELSNYQTIFDHITSTFKFLK